MTTWSRRCIIIHAAIVEPARNLAAALAPEGAGMFTTGCSPTGLAPATHYITEGMIDAQFAALLPLTTVIQPIPPATVTAVTVSPADANVFWGACQQCAAKQPGFVMTATWTDVQALMTKCDVSAQPPFVAMYRLGLQLLRATIP